MINRLFTVLFLFVSLQINSSTIPINDNDLSDTWAKEKVKRMSLEDKIGQIFMVRAKSNWAEKEYKYIEKLIKEYKIGGLIFFQGTCAKQAELTERFQKLSEMPLFIALDAEWGLGMRLEDAIDFPRQLTLGAIRDDKLIYDMGNEIGRELNIIGVNMNFAPVVDVNVNPDNPVINDRSFGENKKNVASKGLAYMKGLQDRGVIACAKHFPGHGDASVDSHLDLPVLNLTKERIWNIELFPFKLLADKGVGSVMVAHLQIPALDDRQNRPTSLSQKAVEGILRDSMDYRGLIVTDALEMKGVAKHFSSSEAAVEAFLAGNDILELPEKFLEAYNGVKMAVETGKISEARLNESVLRILRAKYKLLLNEKPKVESKNILEELNTGKALAIKENLYRKAVTFLGKTASTLPILPEYYGKNIAVVSYGEKKMTSFQHRLSTYFDGESINIPQGLSKKDIDKYYKKLKKFDYVIVGVHDIKKRDKINFGIDKDIVKMLKKLNGKTKLIVTLFGSPYALKLFDANFSIVLAYENDDMAQDMAAQSILGAFEVNGILPVTASPDFKEGDGNVSKKAFVLGYSKPEFVGINSDFLNSNINKIVDDMFETESTPGCQILIAKNGNIIYDKCFGYWDYDKKQPVKHGDIYDLASITKVLSTTISTMKLQDEGKLSINNKFSDYIDMGIDTSDKKDVVIKDAMAHYAALKPWIPAYRNTIDTVNKKIVLSKDYYRKKPEKDFKIKVCDGVYLKNDYRDTLWKMLIESPMLEEIDYKYSDLGLIITKEVIEKITKTELDKYVNNSFYKPMGLKNTGYNPYKRYDKSRIVPSENDKYWRNCVVQGYVHDMWAGMLGGVSGHAGLFSNSRDLARLMQMLLNKGVYGNKKYLSKEVIQQFTTRHPKSKRRGIGWDMKNTDEKQECNISELAPASTFGHYGFTGTGVWADSENDIIYVFLSNRTFPTMENRKLYKNNYRTKIQSVIYEAMLSK